MNMQQKEGDEYVPYVIPPEGFHYVKKNFTVYFHRCDCTPPLHVDLTDHFRSLDRDWSLVDELTKMYNLEHARSELVNLNVEEK
jgi:hypothetical protein